MNLPKEIEDIIIDYKYQLEHQNKMKKICKQLLKKQKPIYVRYTHYESYNASDEIERTTTIEGSIEYQDVDNIKSTDDLVIYIDNESLAPYYYIKETFRFVKELRPYYPYMRKVWIEDWSM